MRTRSAWAIATALISGLTLAIPLTTALGAHAAPRSTPSTTVAASRSDAVTLPTGDLVRLTGSAAKPKVLLKPAATSGIGRVLVEQRLKSELYVIPADAQPYLGRFLDRNLFDVTRLKAAQNAKGQLPVRISYQGSTPSIPGVTLTSASAGVASGYLTARSSREFGRALAAQWTSDNAAHWPNRTTILGGLTKLSADFAGPTTVTPGFRMYTLIIKTIGIDGKPQAFGDLGLMNVDDGQKYVGFPYVVDGEARVSVPAGNYSAVGSDFAETTSGQFQAKIATINEYKVTGAGQTLSLDYRTASEQPSISTPAPAGLQGYSLEWDRQDAIGNSVLGWGFFGDASSKFYVAPAAAPKIGKVAFSQSWQLTGPGDTPAYTYDLATLAPRIPASLATTFRAANLATVTSSYYDDGGSTTGAFVRLAYFPDSFGGGFGSYLPLALGVRRREYVGALGGDALWLSGALQNNDSFDDPGFMDAPDTAIPPGSSSRTAWFRGPLGAGIPKQTSPDFAYCYACRTDKLLEISVAPFTDSTPDHSGEIFGAEDGLPVARFRFYQDGKLVEDKDDYLGDDITVKAAKATYKAVFDVDRRLQAPHQSTQSHTELTFSSAAGTGGKLPSTWYCGPGETADCQVLPVVQAKAALPTSLTGTLPAGKSTITVTVAGVQHAPASAAASATFEIRPAGYFWIPVTLTSVGGGTYRGTVDNTDFAGSNVDVRISAANLAGSTYQQTVLRAYTVAGS